MNAVEQAVYAKLTGAAAVTALLAGTAAVYCPFAPQGSSYPLVVFQKMSGLDDHETPHRSRQLLYLIKAVSSVANSEAGSIDAAIDATLYGSSLSVSGWSEVWLMRETDVEYEEEGADSRPYFHNGGVWRIRVTN